MAFFIPDVSKIAILDEWIIPNIGDIGLFKNNLTVDRDTILTDLVECNFSGYGRVTTVSWTPASLVTGNFAESNPNDCIFTHSGGATANDVYGCFLLDTLGNLLGVEVFAGGPYTMSILDDEIKVAPVFHQGSIDDN